jgi:transketolase C-terminal domain/subunit
VVGGLGSAVAEVLAESGENRVPFKRLGLPPDFSAHIGTQEYQLAAYGLSQEAIVKSLKPILDLVARW